MLFISCFWDALLITLKGTNDSKIRHTLILEASSTFPFQNYAFRCLFKTRAQTFSNCLFIPQYLLQEGIDKTNSHLGVRDLMILV